MFKDKFAFFGQASLSYNLGKTNSVTKNQGFVPNETKSSSNNFGFGLSVSPGITYFFNRKIAVEAGLGSFNFKITKSNNYSQQGKLTYTSVNSNTYFSFSPASMYFGVNFFFGGSDKLQTPKVAQ